MPKRAGTTGNSPCPACRRWRYRRWPQLAHARHFVTASDGSRFFTLGLVKRRVPFGGEQHRAEIDALAVRRGGGKFERLDRVSVLFPPTNNNRIGTSYTSMCGTLVRIEIE